MSKRKVSPRERARRAAQATRTPAAHTPAPVTTLPAVPLAPGDATALTAGDYRSAAGFRFQLPSRPGKYVVVRRTDLFSLFMADAVPLNLLEVVGELEDMHRKIMADPAALTSLDASKKAMITDAINRVVVVVVASPVVTADPNDHDPAHLFVSDLSFADRMAIFLAAQYPPALSAHDVPVTPVPRVAGDAAADFRQQESRPDAVARSNGAPVRSGAVVVDVPRVGPVEYIGA